MNDIIKNKYGVFTKYKNVFWFFITVNLVPSVCLVFTEPLNFVGRILLITFPLGLYLTLFSLYKRIGLIQLLLIPFLVLHAFQLVVFYLFGEEVIAVDMYLNLFTTSSTEAFELLNNLWAAVIFVCILYIPTIIIAIKSQRRKIFLPTIFRKRNILVGVSIIIASSLFAKIGWNKNTGRFRIKEDIYPVNILYNMKFAVNKWEKTSQYMVTSKDFKFNAVRNKITEQREVYVLVIGEASRAVNWSLFDYERKTNPCLENAPGIVFFKDAITQSNTTHKSVPLILSAVSAENYDDIYSQKSIVQAFKEAGFFTVFLSNQPPNHSFTEFFAEEADVNINLRIQPAEKTNVHFYDENLLPYFSHYLDSVKGDVFIVLHTYGSHFNYKERYPKDYSTFLPDDAISVKKYSKEKLINAYDNSILYTDKFLNKLIGSLNHTDICASLLYVSDHGEDLYDDKRNRFLHSSPNPTYYHLHIPFFIWSSGNYQMQFPEKVEAIFNNSTKPVSTNAVFHTLVDIADIKTNYLQENLALSNSKFEVRKRMYLNDHDQPIFFYNAGLRKEDKMMVEKYKLYY